MVTKRIFIKGRVQGVSFRKYTQLRAQELGIYGWVRNLNNGDVEIFAVAPEAVMAEFEKWLQTGSPGARVDHVDVQLENSDDNIKSLKSFDVR